MHELNAVQRIYVTNTFAQLLSKRICGGCTSSPNIAIWWPRSKINHSGPANVE
jgi:hypothetical protein